MHLHFQADVSVKQIQERSRHAYIENFSYNLLVWRQAMVRVAAVAGTNLVYANQQFFGVLACTKAFNSMC